MSKLNNYKYLTKDLKSGFIVSLVALPLCLGIALASGAPLLSGLIAGIVGGIIVGLVSDSHVSVSGPAAGLAVIILGAITELNSFNLLLTCVIFAGLLQLLMGLLKLGEFSKWIHHSVIEGMLAAIGVLIILKQIPYALGFLNFKGYSQFLNEMLNTGTNDFINMGALLIGILCILIIVIYNVTSLKKNKIFEFLPLSILLVFLASVLALFFKNTAYSLNTTQFVNLGGITDGAKIFSYLSAPDFSNLNNYLIFKYSFIIGIVASIETILCINAGDKMDTQKRKTSPNRELVAQGIGNIASGFLGGLPITSVIVRTSVNIQSGAETKFSTLFHGFILLVGLVLFPTLITQIPLAVLACILLLAGYNLAHPRKLVSAIKDGYLFFIPFFTTILVIVIEDLLIGVIVGQVVAILLGFLNSYLSKGDQRGLHSKSN